MRGAGSKVGRIGIFFALLLSSGVPAQEKEKTRTVIIPRSGASFTLKYLPGGTVKIGSPKNDGERDPDEGRVREIVLSPFWIGTHEVTWNEYTPWYFGGPKYNVDGITRPTEPLPDLPKTDPKRAFDNGAEQTIRHPALHVGNYGASGYCEWMSALTGRQFRLPTEAEWEYAARAGSVAPRPKALDEAAWHKENSKGQSYPVGSRKPNAFGLYDMLGNAWEYCLEPYAPPDSVAVVRGGAWNSPRKELRYSNRQKLLIDDWSFSDIRRPYRLWWVTDAQFLGLRVVELPDDGVGKEERAKLLAKVRITSLKILGLGKGDLAMTRVEGKVEYSGDRMIDELEVKVHYLDEDGKPYFEDRKEKPTFSRAYPVLLNSYHPGEHRKPLKKGGKRTFIVDVPHPFDEVGPLDLQKVGAFVTRIHFARP